MSVCARLRLRPSALQPARAARGLVGAQQSRPSARGNDATMRMQSTLAYRVFEDTSNGFTPTKTALIMHGILGNKLNWRTFAMRLAAANPDWRFIALDHRGHGDSPSFSVPHTIEACADDVIKLAEELKVEPDAVFGHSFGGKIALQYLATCHEQFRKPPSQVWVLDSLPGTAETDYKTRNLTASIENVLPRLKEIPLPIHSKPQLIKDLTAKGIGLGEAQWLTTNLRLVSSQPEQYDWKMDVPVIEQLFQAFLSTDLWPVVSNNNSNAADDETEIHFVYAERNSMWTPQVLRDLDALRPRNVHRHLLQNSGHWVHIDNPNGLFAIIEKHF
uniref:AB hydrolase-1 domain-containing protein n=1 Tax=Globisporangium ultimum (strain ATCC 200006 / CBS 805.95 / DAOM BR144) TaxID=431595 RepID=K3WZR1_GLOUD